MLPNVNAVVASFFALQGIGRVPAMLNYTAGLANLKSACVAAEVRTIVTARAFVEQTKLGEVLAGLEATASVSSIWRMSAPRSVRSRSCARWSRRAGRSACIAGMACRPTRRR